MTAYQAPKDIWEASANIQFDQSLEADDLRFVETSAARGESFSYKMLYRYLGISPRTLELKKVPKESQYILFCGHRGSGKSTELKRLANHLHAPEHYFVVSFDVLKYLDINNLQYPDVMMGLVKRLLEEISSHDIQIHSVFLSNLENWFVERIENHSQTQEFAAEVKTKASAKTGIPLLLDFYAGITTALRINSTYKEELRRITKNHFTDFAAAFNQLISAAEDQIIKQQHGKKLLFIIDGIDRLNQEDSQRFFIDDAYQLQTLNGQFIYCTPIHLIYEKGQINQIYPHRITLPMIMLYTETGEKIDSAFETLKKVIYHRVDASLFPDKKALERMIHYSGGHLRDLLRLLTYAFGQADNDVFDAEAIENAIKELRNDYRRLLEKDDINLLVAIDNNPREIHGEERVRKLLYDLALLEYNSFWWKSHPVIRDLPAYQHALANDA